MCHCDRTVAHCTNLCTLVCKHRRMCYFTLYPSMSCRAVLGVTGYQHRTKLALDQRHCYTKVLLISCDQPLCKTVQFYCQQTMCIGIHGLAEVIHSVFYTQVKHCHCNSSDSLLLFRCSLGCVQLCFTLHVPLDSQKLEHFKVSNHVSIMTPRLILMGQITKTCRGQRLIHRRNAMPRLNALQSGNVVSTPWKPGPAVIGSV